MTFSGKPLVSILLLLGLAPHTAQAQAARGTVREQQSGTPVPGAEVYLLDVGDSIVAVASTDEGGRFAVTASLPGTYWLTVSRMGYESMNTASFVLMSGEDREFEIFLPVDPVSLDSLRVVGNPKPTRLALTGFYNRMEKGFGYFIQREEIDEHHATEVTDLLYGLPNVRVVRGTVNMRNCMRSPTIILDGMAEGGRINELIHPANIEAIEVYLGPGGVPPEYGGLRNPCGAILIWTRW